MLNFLGMIEDIKVQPQEENYCSEIPSAEASRGQIIGDLFDKFSFSHLHKKIIKDENLEFSGMKEDLQV